MLIYTPIATVNAAVPSSASYDKPGGRAMQRRILAVAPCRRFFVLALAVLWGLLAPTAGFAAAGGFLPHRAVYDLDLASADMNSNVTDADGRFEFEWDDACSGWTVSQRSVIRVTYSSGQVVEFGWTLNSWEAKDGLSYRFFIREVYAGSPVDETRGKARLDRIGGNGVATFVQPKERQIDLPTGTIFPTRHSLDLLEAVDSDAMPLWRQVFDGSGDTGFHAISAVQSAALEPGLPSSLESDLTRGEPSWRLQLAFFSSDDSMAEPEQEQALRIFRNGVSDEIVFDYGDFALDAELIELEALSAPDC